MKKLETSRLEKMLKDLKKVAELLKGGKADAALKKVNSLAEKCEAKLSGSKKKASKPRKLTKYNLFVKSNFAKVAAENPNLSTTEVMVALSKLYKASKKSPSSSAASVKSASSKASKASKASKKSSPKKSSPKKAVAKKCAPKM